MKGQGQDEKVMINFRISKDRKRQLEYLAKLWGKSVTQILDEIIITNCAENLEMDGRDQAFEQAAIKVGIHPAIAKVMGKHRGADYESTLKMKAEVLEEINREYEATAQDFINANWKEYGIDKEREYLEKLGYIKSEHGKETEKKGVDVDYWALEFHEDLDKAIKSIDSKKNPKKRGEK